MPELPAACRDHLAAIAPRDLCPIPTGEELAAFRAWKAAGKPDARAQGMADANAGRPSRFVQFTGPARSAYIVGYSDATRVGWHGKGAT